MEPIEFKEQTNVYTKPDSMTDEECGSLPVLKCEDRIFSCWKMTFSERVKALITGKIWFSILCDFQPPISLGVDKPFRIENGR